MAKLLSSQFFQIQRNLLLFIILMSPFYSWGGVTGTLQQTATTLRPDEYELRASLDIILNHSSGVNASGHFKSNLIEDMLDVEGYLGTGKTNFQAGILSKFNFLPDLPDQIGLAFLGSYTFVSDDYQGADSDILNVVGVSAIASNKWDMSFGEITPYAGLQAEFLFKSDDFDFPLSAIVGAEWSFSELRSWSFFSEFDIDISDSVFLIGLGGAFRF